jgi:NodT family efflux transporter outer membrane factor (OMF) lipoprotein
MKFASFAALVISIFLTGCAVGPNYRRTQASVPAQWTAPVTNGTQAGAEPTDDEWWKSFNDQELDLLLQRAAQANYDVKLSVARLEEARAATGIAKSAFYPQISAGVSAERVRQIGVGLVPSSQKPGGVRPQLFAYDINNYQGRFDAAWELDVFGRIRREREAARADFRATEQERRDILISVFGDIGRYYAELRGLQLRLEIANKNVAVAEDELKLTRDLAQAGQVTERDVAQAEAQLESTRAQIPQLKAGIEVSIHRLSVLTGQQPGALDKELTTRSPLPVLPPDVAVGLPSDLLTRRPDIQRAEAQLAAATARVGVAKADYFPTFTLFGSAGRQAAQLHDLTLGLGNFFAAGPSVSVPVFTGGRIRSNVAVQNARVKQAQVIYQKTVLTSLEETENALVNYADEQSRRDHLDETVRASQDALNLANDQYRAGLADFLTVLDSERTLFANQDLLAQSQTFLVVDLVALYKAIGGGWQNFPPNLAPNVSTNTSLGNRP